MKTLRLVLLGSLLVSLGSANALAQEAPKWKPRVESIVVRAGAMKNWRLALSASHLGQAFMVSASIPVPLSDLDLAKQSDADEMGRRISVAARLVCEQLDKKYPPAQFPIVEGYSGFECASKAAKDGMDQVNTIIASARR
jgi:UrcA family protein